MHNSLCSTIELKLWQETFAEDICNLLTMIKKAPHPAMMANFYKKLTKTSSSAICSLPSWHEPDIMLFLIQAFRDKPDKDLAGQMLVSGLAVPMDWHTEEQDEVKGKPNWLTALLSFTNMLTQAGTLFSCGSVFHIFWIPDISEFNLQAHSPPSSSSTLPPLLSSPVLNILLAVPHSAGGFIDCLSNNNKLTVDDEQNPDYIIFAIPFVYLNFY
ncbi:hypothetical protein ARMGADRAFT_1091686 [Armillaria gallica]|uniref:eIF3a PCI domain-containing protein n=1 Tax=Armillaria gallica TaxID=47427 RepID=A0A2H3CDA2_ARMGA|nr:hypothetical protein ARMGADRAFT_1091686 [Armillaria gallica]